MTGDKRRSREELEDAGAELVGNSFIKIERGGGGQDLYYPLYEAKMFYQYNHRYGTFEGATSRNINSGVLPRLSPEQLNNPHQVVLPRYWVKSDEVETRIKRDWFLCFRDITNSRSERTFISCILPRVAIGNSAPVLLIEGNQNSPSLAIYANCNSFAFDFVARQKAGGNHLNYFIVKQLPMLPPSAYTQDLLDFIARACWNLAIPHGSCAPSRRIWAIMARPFAGTTNGAS